MKPNGFGAGRTHRHPGRLFIVIRHSSRFLVLDSLLVGIGLLVAGSDLVRWQRKSRPPEMAISAKGVKTRAGSTRWSGGHAMPSGRGQDLGAPDQLTQQYPGTTTATSRIPFYVLEGTLRLFLRDPKEEVRLGPGRPTRCVRVVRTWSPTRATAPRPSWCPRNRRVRLRPLT